MMAGTEQNPIIVSLGQWVVINGFMFQVTEFHQSVDSPPRAVLYSAIELMKIDEASAKKAVAEKT